MSFDREWRVTSVSADAGDLFRLERCAVIGRVLSEIGPAPAIAALMRVIPSIERHPQRPVDVEFQDAGRWIKSRLCALHDAQQGWIGYLLLGWDLTEAKEVETALRLSEERLRRTVDAAPWGMHFYRLDQSGRLILVGNNPAATRILGIDHAPLYGKVIEEAFPGLRNTEVPARYRELASGSGEWRTERITYRDSRVDAVFEVAAFQTGPGHVAAAFLDVTERKRANDAVRRSRDTLLEQQKALAALMRRAALSASDSAADIRSLTETGARTLGVERVSVWRFSADKAQLQCLDLFELSEARHSSGAALTMAQYPAYVQALYGEEAIVADDAHTHPDTREFSAGYLTPLGIASMLDIPVHRYGTLEGVICFEHVGAPISWSAEQRYFAVALANLVALALEQDETRRAEEEIRRLNEQLERRVTDRTAQLAQANRELESFSYSVSHDLRAPLRAIDGFTALLESDHGAELDEEGQDYLHRVRAAAQRMAHLIDDLLDLSRLSRRELHAHRIDLSALAGEIAGELAQREPQRAVEVVIAPGICVRADPLLMRVVLENLLGNAWKFSSRRARARIELGQDQRPEGRVYFVRDNGAGFDMAYAGKLFAPFQRLHAATAFEGNGIGLATVQRIIHRHGGKVWADGAVEHGATFFFTIGCQAENAAPTLSPAPAASRTPP
jgi:PAS domain S-box-containing protein